MRFSQLVCLICAYALAALPAVAQKKPKENAEVLVGLVVAARGMPTDQRVYVSAWEPGQAMLFDNNYAGVGTGATTYTPGQQFKMKPGHHYQMRVIGTWMEYAEIKFNAPPGYAIYVDGKPNPTVRTPTYNGYGDYLCYLFELRSLTDSSALPAGEARAPQVGDVAWSISAGAVSGGRTAGAIHWRSSSFGPELLSADSLSYVSAGHPEILPGWYSNNEIMALSTPQANLYVRRYAGTNAGFAVEVYAKTAYVTSGTGDDPRQFSEQPFREFKFTNPHASWQNEIQVERLDRNELGVTKSQTWSLKRIGSNWEIVHTEELRVTTLTSTIDPVAGTRTEVVEVERHDQVVAAKTTRTYQNYPWGQEEMISSVDDPGNPNGEALTTLYEYHTSSGAHWGRLKSVQNPDGSWERYEYDNTPQGWGNLTAVYRPWQDGPADPAAADATNAHVTLMTFVPERQVFNDLLGATEVRALGTTIGKSTVSHSFPGVNPANNQPLRTESSAVFTASGASLPTAATYYHHTADERYRGRLYSKVNPDGTKVATSYIRGSLQSWIGLSHALMATHFAPSAQGVEWCDTPLFGTSTQTTPESVQVTTDGMTNGATISPVWMIPYKSTRKQVCYDVRGVPTFELVQVFNGTGYDLVAWEHKGIWADGLLYSTHNQYGELWSVARIGGHVVVENEVGGKATEYWRDSLGRATRKEVKGMAADGSYPGIPNINTYYTYDAMNRVLTEKTTVDGVEYTTTKVYTLAGLLKSETNASGLTTTYSYTNGGRTVTTTAPGGYTSVTARYLDGSPKSVTGTAVVPSYVSRWFTTSGAEKGFIITRTRLRTEADSRYTDVITDWAGRVVRERRRDGQGGTVDKNYVYNAKGQLIKTTETGVSAPTLYTYNGLGEVETSGLDVDANGALTTASSDRMTKVQSKYVSSESVWWNEVVTEVYGTEGSGTPTQASRVWKKVGPFFNPGEEAQSDYFNGRVFKQTRTWDIFGNLTILSSVSDRVTKVATVTVDVPDSTVDAQTVMRNGLVFSKTNSHGQTTTYTYDGLWRQIAEVDPRTGASTTAYHTSGTGAKGQVAWKQNAAGNRTSFYYSATDGRLSYQTDPLGKATRFSYNSRGQLTRQWGEATYPVEYGYSGYGEKTTMKTFRSGSGTVWAGATWPASPPAADTTTWAYQASTGLLLSKTDAAGRTVSYTYTPRWQLATRTWARGVTTTYTYSAVTGEQTGITYSDGTPNLSYTYDRLGRPHTISDVLGTRTHEHCVCGKLTKETLPSGWGGLELSYQLDTTGAGTKGRTTGYQLGIAGNPALHQQVTYGYDGYGRFGSLTDVNTSATFSYGYLVNSNLISTVTHGTMIQAMQYEPQRDHLDWVDTSVGGVSQAKFDYAVDALGRRTATEQSGKAFEGYLSNGLSYAHLYNDRSELTQSLGRVPGSSTQVPGRKFDYAYDSIGNRSSSHVDDRGITYTTNKLNQYTQRTVPNYLDVAGMGPAGATITVDGMAVTRQAEFFYRAKSVAGPSWVTTSVSSTYGGSETRQQHVPGSPEAYTYDEDGNLLSDGRWSYTWDAENRLTSLETVAAAYNAGAPRQRLDYSYDYLGRRVQKTFATWSGTSWVPETITRFIYDGWNLIAEFNGAMAIQKSYTWGLDISRTLADAGGVKGLLMIRDHVSNATNVPAYDGNGNVALLINGSSGALDAIYEYSPYGESLRASGAFAQSNPFRFSTKYTDSETGYVYYGKRFYDPKLGRFVGRDAIAEKGGINLFAFAGNNPLNMVDYLGMIASNCWFAGGVWNCDSDNFAVDSRDVITMDPYEVRESGRGGPSADEIEAEMYPQGLWGPDPFDFIPDEAPSYDNTPVSNKPESKESAPNNPERWSDEKCKGLAAQIASAQGALNQSLNAMNAGRSFLDMSRTDYVGGRMAPGSRSAADWVSMGSDSLSVAGALLLPGGSKTATAGVVIGGVSNVANTGLAGYAYSQGRYGDAIMHGTAAVTDLMSVASNTIPALKVVTVPVDVFKAGLGVSMILIDSAQRESARSAAEATYGSHFDRMQSIEGQKRADIGAQQALYDAHCK